MIAHLVAACLISAPAEELKRTAAEWEAARAALSDRFRMELVEESVQRAKSMRGIGPDGEDFPREDLSSKREVSLVRSGDYCRVDEVRDAAKGMNGRGIIIHTPETVIRFMGAGDVINPTGGEGLSHAFIHRSSDKRKPKLLDNVSYTPLWPYVRPDFIGEFKESKRGDGFVTLVAKRENGWGFEVDVEMERNRVIRAVRRTAGGFAISVSRATGFARTNGIWFPDSWTTTEYAHTLGRQGKEVRTENWKVRDLSFPVATPASKFELKFPSKTLVRDYRGAAERDYTTD